MNSADLTPSDLADALRRSAKGIYSEEAAVELLIAHQTWLRRNDFRPYIRVFQDEPDDTPMAAIKWLTLVAAIDGNRFAASGGELQILCAATSLTRNGHWVLHDLISSLDVVNLGLLFQAMAHARGWHERGHTATITGDFTPPRTAEPGTFEDSRRSAHALLGDAADHLRAGDWTEQPNHRQRLALGTFWMGIEYAKSALNDVARAASER